MRSLESVPETSVEHMGQRLYCGTCFRASDRLLLYANGDKSLLERRYRKSGRDKGRGKGRNISEVKRDILNSKLLPRAGWKN